MDPKEHEDEKAGLIGVALVVGVIVFIAICTQRLPAAEQVNVGSIFSPLYETRQTTALSMWHRSGAFITFAAFAAVATSFLYVLFAAKAAELFVDIRSWAYCGRAERPRDNEILVIGTFWPITLLGGGLIYLFIGVINRSFT